MCLERALREAGTRVCTVQLKNCTGCLSVQSRQSRALHSGRALVQRSAPTTSDLVSKRASWGENEVGCLKNRPVLESPKLAQRGLNSMALLWAKARGHPWSPIARNSVKNW